MSEISIAENKIPITEIRDAIDKLSLADGQRLLSIARLRCYGTGMDADDLFQEAVERALDGRRRCPYGVNLLVFLTGAIRSIADDDRKKRNRERAAKQGKAIDTSYAKNTTDISVDTSDVEKKSECKAMVGELFSVLEGDEEAQLVLMGDLEELTAEEIRDMNGMNKTALATVRRRIRRKISKAFPKGWSR